MLPYEYRQIHQPQIQRTQSASLRGTASHEDKQAWLKKFVESSRNLNTLTEAAKEPESVGGSSTK